LQASKDENTLQVYRYKANFKASPGESGKSKDQYGANAESLILTVPLGTIVRDKQTDEILYAFTKDGEQRTAVYGGE
jgi:GTP-binding protein